MPEIDPNERLQIQICRVLCIFFMMSVHVPPGRSSPSLMSTGDLAWLGYVWADVLGRASVTALSFISGYLLVRMAAEAPLAQIARRRFRSVIVPMLVWNAVFIAMVACKALLAPDPGAPWLRTDAGLLAALTGLTGPTANLSLFFLRDLFVSSLVVRLALGWLRRWPAAVLTAVAIVTVFDLAEPLIFRPSILFFAMAGAAHAQRASRLTEVLTRRLGIVLALAIGLAVAARLGLPNGGTPQRELEALLKHSLLAALVIAVSAGLTRNETGAALARLEPRIFETYLLHVPLISAAWFLWLPVFGSANLPGYAIFFFAAPLISMVAGQIFGILCDRWPGDVQRLVRGKTAGARRATA